MAVQLFNPDEVGIRVSLHPFQIASRAFIVACTGEILCIFVGSYQNVNSGYKDFS